MTTDLQTIKYLGSYLGTFSGKFSMPSETDILICGLLILLIPFWFVMLTLLPIFEYYAYLFPQYIMLPALNILDSYVLGLGILTYIISQSSLLILISITHLNSTFQFQCDSHYVERVAVLSNGVLWSHHGQQPFTSFKGLRQGLRIKICSVI